MTLRTIEEQLSELILNQAQTQTTEFNLSINSAVFDLIHPKILKAQLEFKQNPHMASPTASPGEFFQTYYSNLNEAKKAHPYIQQMLKGYPYVIYQWLKVEAQSIFLDFSPLGIVAISRKPLVQGSTSGVHLHTLPIWMTYALSPELWNETGKWTRFHERLHTLFDKYHLLKEEDFPGYYHLVPKAQFLEEFGFLGTLDQNGFSLTMPWTFPLSGLERLEKIIPQES